MEPFKIILFILPLQTLWVGLCYSKVDPELRKAFRTSKREDILIHFVGANRPVLDSIESQFFPSHLSKVKALVTELKAHTQVSQRPIQRFLTRSGVPYDSFWSSNQMVVRGANSTLVQAISEFRQVSNVQTAPKSSVDPISSSAGVKVESVQWGIDKVRADQVWSQFAILGQGVVVANIDTGVRGTHEALSGNWRQDRGWFDPYKISTVPTDQHGHGTHTIGTIAGLGGIGVAPGALWVACRGCDDDGCESSALLSCGQWMLEPTHPNGTGGDLSMIPDVISNSWGSPISGRPWYNPTIEAWTAAGILHAFAAGNSGPFCPTVGTPADQEVSFAVGSTTIRDRLSFFSSRNGALARRIKPEISAPGSDVYSAWKDSDVSYNTISGTSMACPHVAGGMALVLSAYRDYSFNPSARLRQADVVSILEKNTDTQGLSLGITNFPYCAGTASRFPNNYFGYGRMNTLKAVSATIDIIGRKIYGNSSSY